MADAAMYIGQYEHTVDAKGRLFLPARFRAVGTRFVITRGLEVCLNVYDLRRWAQVLEKLEGLEVGDQARARGFKRALLSGAYEADCDGQGRVLLPPPLKGYARISTAVTIIGVGTRMEVWDRSRWNAYDASTANAAFRSLSRRLEL